MKHRYGAAAPWTLGIEEEVILVDAVTFETAPSFTHVVAGASPELEPEVFECLAELATPVVPDAPAALVELARLRRELAGLVESHGLRLHAAGTHALARGESQPIVPVERYRRMAETLGPGIYRQLVCGLHVHVSIPDPETCLRAFESVVPWLPTLLALSANSPFAEGRATGRRSERACRLLEMPTGGTPPVLASWDDWKAATAGDGARRHWDAWPRPEYGTLEVRVMDMQTDVRRSAGLAAIVRALAERTAEETPDTYDRSLYSERRTRAASSPPARDEVEALRAAIEPQLDTAARALALPVLDDPSEADRQREVAAASGIPAVPRDVVARTLDFA